MTQTRHDRVRGTLRGLTAGAFFLISACAVDSDPTAGTSPGSTSAHREPPPIFVPVADADGEYTGEFELPGPPPEADQAVELGPGPISG
ncbi:MAG: hypothetical protein P1V81_07710 [Planctomycetota bacterium]|nr:hypothetical protein [Planctomycetota bacterium]